MKKTTFVILLIALVPALVFAGSKMSVEVRQVNVKSAPNYLSGTTATLNYATQVEVSGEQDNWYQITSPSGWVPKNTLTKHKIDINADKKMAGGKVSHDEVALAGKGFNPQVEAQYKKDNADLRNGYAQVDTIEKFGATDNEIMAFQKAGKLEAR